MTLSSTTNRVSYSGNDVTTAFSFPYYFLSDSDLVVISKVTSTGVETTKILTTDYTVTGAGSPSGGSVTMLTAPATGTTLSIYRDPAKTQDLDLVENDPMPAEEIEKRFDKLTMLVQRLSDRLDRAVRLTDGFAASFSTLLPTVLNAGKALIINSGGDGLDTQTISDSTISSPLTTKGDLISYSTLAARLGVGTDGQVLTADSSQPVGIGWFADKKAFVSKTSNFTATAAEAIISCDATSAGFTITLPTAVGISGKEYHIQKSDSSANVVTIATTSSQTINGVTTQTLDYQYSGLTLFSDGANWRIK